MADSSSLDEISQDVVEQAKIRSWVMPLPFSVLAARAILEEHESLS